jgi:transcriptional regulator with XRE-family HTH domain
VQAKCTERIDRLRLHRRRFEARDEYEEEVINAEIARKIFALRTKAGVTQQQLAARVGTTKSAISRREDADYEGHSLSMLKRIAEALDKRVEIRLLAVKTTADGMRDRGLSTFRARLSTAF